MSLEVSSLKMSSDMLEEDEAMAMLVGEDDSPALTELSSAPASSAIDSAPPLSSSQAADSSQRIGPALASVDDEDEEYVTPAQVLSEMRVAWLNERAVPTLLPHRFDLVACLQEQVDSINEATTAPRNKGKASTSIHRLEMLRVQYLLADYARIRLVKIETHPGVFLKEHDTRMAAGEKELLSENEKTFTIAFLNAEARLMHASLLGALPPSLQTIPRPQHRLTHERCFAQVVADETEDVAIPDPEDPNGELIIKLARDTIHCIPFESVREHVENEKIILM